MLPKEDYVRMSLGTNLFFLRIMKEHALFLKASFTAKNVALAETAGYFMRQYDSLLHEAVQLADGALPQSLLRSGQFTTQYTPDAEKVTQFYTGILVDTSLTLREAGLTPAAGDDALTGLEGSVSDLNQRSQALTTAMISLKNKLLTDVLACRLFMEMYPSMIEHILREAVYFSGLLIKLQNRVELRSEKNLIDLQVFWNPVIADHARFTEGMLDPAETQLKMKAHMLAQETDAAATMAKQAQDNPALAPQATTESSAGAQNARDFAASGVSGLLSCKLRSIILPLLADHILRETNHYVYLLQVSQSIPNS